MSDKDQTNNNWSRRNFIQTAVMTAAALAIPGCSRKEKPVLTTLVGDFDPLRSYPYRGWEDFYRKIWTWDKEIGRASCRERVSYHV